MNKEPAICKECGEIFLNQDRCPNCHSPRILSHKELFSLNIAHIDCDAFYASIEKSNDVKLINKPVIVGGGRRGIVTTCCYIARISGVKSAMPIYVAKKLCPKAIIIPPRMDLYKKISKLIFSKMSNLTPLVETVALDEAYLDFSGTFQLHGKTPVELLIKLAKEIETELNITISVGLSENLFLAKLASSMNKPRSFTIIGKHEKLNFINNLPVTYIPGVGPKLNRKLKQDSIEKFHHLIKLDQDTLEKRYGSYGKSLWSFARGEDNRTVKSNSLRKSISKEITFDHDLCEEKDLEKALWVLSENVSEELKTKGIMGKTVTIKLKRSNFQLSCLSHTHSNPIYMAEDLYEVSLALLSKKLSFCPFRLVGLSISKLFINDKRDKLEKSLDIIHLRKHKTELAIDKIRSKFGKNSISKGRSL